MHAQFKHQLTPAIRHKALAHPMFDALSDDEVELIFTLVSYGALHEGDRIFKEGDPGNQCYFCISSEGNTGRREDYDNNYSHQKRSRAPFARMHTFGIEILFPLTIDLSRLRGFIGRIENCSTTIGAWI